ncbi:MAG: right-handed parallel beta-helix repeat-containing protein [Acidobacteria bacterium]|nr:right-handed parallel beta-helix repeat-containing protein [Acidobacteriota bacterium]
MTQCRIMLVMLFAAWSAGAETLYVSAKGRASWSGRMAEPNAQATDGPLPSLDAARDAIRKLRTSGGARPFTVRLKAGVYFLDAPFVLEPRDSGTAAAPVVYEAAAGEFVVVSGGRPVEGWRKSGEHLLTASLPEAWTPRQLFLSNRRAQRARTPNYGFLRIPGHSSHDKLFRLPFHDGMIRKSWEKGQVEILAWLGWTAFRRPIVSVDEAAGVATLAGGPGGSEWGIVEDAEGRYIIENAPEALDEPGEWYLDRAAGRLSYWPKSNENPGQDEVIAARLPQLVRFEGKPERGEFVRHITLRGIRFRHADWTMPADGYADTPQAAVGVGAAIEAAGAEDCAVERCSFSQIGGYAVWFRGATHRNRVVGNQIYDAGAGGIKLGETAMRATAAEQSFENVISDNHIFNLGRVYPNAIGIWLGQTSRNEVSHNLIHDVYYSGISAGWVWGYTPSQCQENRIEYNHVHHIGLDTLNDLGGIYVLGVRGGTIRNNLVHDVRSFSFRGRGIYLDEGSTNVLVEKNVVYRVKSSAFHLHYGKENIVRNNVFALNDENQVSRAKAEAHRSFTFERNILYAQDGVLFGTAWGAGVDLDNNLYFDARTNTPRFAGRSFDAWKALGRDAHSVIADPRFVDILRDDFRLRKDSPALRLGIESIDMSTVGPRSSL